MLQRIHSNLTTTSYGDLFDRSTKHLTFIYLAFVYSQCIRRAARSAPYLILIAPQILGLLKEDMLCLFAYTPAPHGVLLLTQFRGTDSPETWRISQNSSLHVFHTVSLGKLISMMPSFSTNSVPKQPPSLDA